MIYEMIHEMIHEMLMFHAMLYVSCYESTKKICGFMREKVCHRVLFLYTTCSTDCVHRWLDIYIQYRGCPQYRVLGLEQVSLIYVEGVLIQSLGIQGWLNVAQDCLVCTALLNTC